MSTQRQNDYITGWQLLLLGATSVVLSIASGWTTWDGMRNFTDEPVLSLMITFGIQGVMLIAAWLIGDSFARARTRTASYETVDSRPFASRARTAFLIMLILSLVLIAMTRLDLWPRDFGAISSGLAFLNDPKVLMVAGLAVVAAITFAARDVIFSYLEALHIVARHAVLWIMFAACMATSVFFSFDSLFSTIFSEDERARTADVRARSETSAIIFELSDLTSRRQAEHRTALLVSKAWLDYSAELDGLSAAAQAGPAAIDESLRQDLLSSQDAAAQSRSRLQALETEASRFSQRKNELSRKAATLRTQAAALQSKLDDLDSSIFQKDREIIAKAAEAEAEATGIGQSAKAGRGPRYRELSDQLTRLKAEKSNLELQLDAYRERLAAAQEAVTNAETELAEARTLGEQVAIKIKALEPARSPGLQADTADVLKKQISSAAAVLAMSRSEFELNPTRAHLEALQSGCSGLLAVLSDATPLADKVGGFNCQPGAVHEAAVELYAMNAGVKALAGACAAGQAPISDGVDTQLAHARTCLQHAQLSGTDADAIRHKIDSLARVRDDVAHRFVVSANALSDGHNLAFLALAIAIAIDALVFMSGLFGANIARRAARAPAKADPRADRYAAETIQSALLPDGFRTASQVLEVIQPVSEPHDTRGMGPGWTHEAKLDEVDSSLRGAVRKLLNAGAAVDRVRRSEKRSDHYFLRDDFIGLLCDAARATFEEAGSTPDLPDLTAHAPTLLRYLKPSSIPGEHAYEIMLAEVAEQDRSAVRRCLDALCSLRCAKLTTAQGDEATYSVHDGIYAILASLSDGARTPIKDREVEPGLPATDRVLRSVARRGPPAPKPRAATRTVPERTGGNGRPASTPDSASPSATAVVGRVFKEPAPKTDA